jgi:hypothetical protein
MVRVTSQSTRRAEVSANPAHVLKSEFLRIAHDLTCSQDKVRQQDEIAQNQFALICRQEDRIKHLEKTCATLWSVLSGNDKLWDEANRKLSSPDNTPRHTANGIFSEWAFVDPNCNCDRCRHEHERSALNTGTAK